MRSPQHQLTVGGYFWLHVLLVQTWVDAPKSSFQHLFCILMENAQPNFSPNLDRWWKMMMNDGLFPWFVSWQIHDYRTYKFDHLFPSSYARCRAEILLRSHGRGGALQCGEPQPGTRRCWLMAVSKVGPWCWLNIRGLSWLNMWYVICDKMFN